MISQPVVKLFTIIVNFFLILYALTLVIVGIHIILDHGIMLEITYGSIYLTGTYILIFCGIILFLSVIISFVGTFKNDRFLLIAYLIMLIILLIFTFIGSILVLAFPATINDEARSNMRKTLKEHYGRTKLYTDAWNETQSRLRCCGVDDGGWDVYQDSYWDKMTNLDLNNRENKISKYNPYYKFVPISCCWLLVDPQTGWPSVKFRNEAQCQQWQFGPPNIKSGPHNDAVYYRGCAEAIKGFMGMYSRGYGALSFIFLLVLIASAILTLILLKKSSKKLKKERQDRDDYSEDEHEEDIPPKVQDEKLAFNPDVYRDDEDSMEEEEDYRNDNYSPRA